jgi:hypothetical protein
VSWLSWRRATELKAKPHLIFATLASIGSLDVHHEDVHLLALRHPDPCARTGRGQLSISSKQ